MWTREHCLPASTIVFRKKDGTVYDEEMTVGIQLHHEEYDFETSRRKNSGSLITHLTNYVVFRTNGRSGWDNNCWRIEPKRRDGSSLGRDEVETGKEIDVLVTLFYDDGQGDQCEQMGVPKSFKCVVGPGEPISMKLIVPHNNDGDNTITITNGSSLEGRGLNVMNGIALTPHPLTYPIKPPPPILSIAMNTERRALVIV